MRKMYSVVLIILGATLLIAGIYGLLSQKSNVDADEGRPVPADSLLSEPDNGLSENERKGQQFEDYVISRFAPGDYKLIEKVNDYTSRHHVTERSKYPDLVLEKVDTKEQFAVECKYRSGWVDSNGKPALIWVKQYKIDDYNKYSNDHDFDVIVVFGVGGTPDNPEEVFALPLRLLQKPLPQNQEFLRRFKVPDGNLEYEPRQHNLKILR
ncbi:MAG: hypothetical protein IKQ77_17140 [Prevotella sp.]|nr:hypothetical protein [Prevotella sp.]